MQKLPILAALAATAGVAAAQNPRTPVRVDTASNFAEVPCVASDQDLSAILYQVDADNSLWVTTSDGRGINWTAPVRIDDKPSGSPNFILTRKSLRVENGNIFACWRDDRNGAVDDMYFTVSTDGGATWAANVLLDKGYPTGGNPVRDYAFDVDGDSAAVLIATDNGDEDLFLVVSTSASTGAFSAAIPASTFNGLGDADAIDLEIEGDLVHFAYNHDTTGVNQTYYSVYDLAGGTFLTQDLLVSANAQAAGGDSAGALDISCQGSEALIGWEVDDVNGASEELWVNLIESGVALGDVQIGGYLAGTDDVDQTTVFHTGTRAIVAWEDNRTGGDECYVASSDLTGGAFAFGAETQFTSGGGGFPSISGGGDYFACTATGGGFPEAVNAIASRDGGTSFGTPFVVSNNAGFDADFAEVAFNEVYGNFVVSYLADELTDNECYAGGFRVQSVAAVGTFSAGSPVSFEVSNFGLSEDGQNFAVVASNAMGSIVLPDGRDIGLANGTIYNYTRSRVPGQFSGALSGGAGSLATFNLPNVAPGTTIYFTAVGFDASANLYSITDVQSVTTL